MSDDAMPEVIYIDWPPNRSGFVVGCIEPFNAVEYEYIKSENSIGKQAALDLLNNQKKELEADHKAELIATTVRLADEVGKAHAKEVAEIVNEINKLMEYYTDRDSKQFRLVDKDDVLYILNKTFKDIGNE